MRDSDHPAASPPDLLNSGLIFGRIRRACRDSPRLSGAGVGVYRLVACGVWLRVRVGTVRTLRMVKAPACIPFTSRRIAPLRPPQAAEKAKIELSGVLSTT